MCGVKVKKKGLVSGQDHELLEAQFLEQEEALITVSAAWPGYRQGMQVHWEESWLGGISELGQAHKTQTAEKNQRHRKEGGAQSLGAMKSEQL